MLKKFKTIKAKRRQRSKYSIRKRIEGSATRPRLTVFRSGLHIYAQAIDDVAGTTLASASTVEKDVRDTLKNKTSDMNAAKVVGVRMAEKLKGLGIESLVFDRNGFLYHGRIEALANSMRESGLKF